MSHEYEGFGQETEKNTGFYEEGKLVVDKKGDVTVAGLDSVAFCTSHCVHQISLGNHKARYFDGDRHHQLEIDKLLFDAFKKNVRRHLAPLSEGFNRNARIIDGIEYTGVFSKFPHATRVQCEAVLECVGGLRVVRVQSEAQTPTAECDS